ncbi:uncharacterized protein [Hyperolius riggenbachi]|uniref:uncharacterized protein n=1 Tax=Hyperolius riggenbachi TaxID=752182 RepID=UPI0035A2A357
MGNWLGFSTVRTLRKKESKVASEAQQRTLRILQDTLKKKDYLLVDETEMFDDWELRHLPLISTELVKDLISQLQTVTFRRERASLTDAYVCPASEGQIICLGRRFWRQPKFLKYDSRPEILIHGVSQLLGFRDSPENNTAKAKNYQQNKQCPLSATAVQLAFSVYMSHKKNYNNGSYSCCGERAKDTVCEKSLMSLELKCLWFIKGSLLNEVQSRQACVVQQRALNILQDTLKKKDSLLVDDPDEFVDQQLLGSCPLISTHLVKDLIHQLQEVTFRGNKHLETGTTIAHVSPDYAPRVIYLCPLFWKQDEFLAMNSQPETLFHEASHLLGYGHTIKKNQEKVKMSPQHKLCPVSVYCIEAAFAFYMNHRGSYVDGSYTCCGETFRDTVCEKSVMSSKLRYLRERKEDVVGLNEEMLEFFHIWVLSMKLKSLFGQQCDRPSIEDGLLLSHQGLLEAEGVRESAQEEVDIWEQILSIIITRDGLTMKPPESCDSGDKI